jgi:excinuclease UvrABC nuclease subunit
VICLAKREEKLVIPIKRHDLKTHAFIERKLPKGPAKNLVQRIRDEAHRFARRYHHKLLQKELIPSK